MVGAKTVVAERVVDRYKRWRRASTGCASSWAPTRSPDHHDRSRSLCGCEHLLELASDAIEESGATRAEPIDYEGIRERYLPDYRFSGRAQHHKSHYALSAAAMIRGGVYPDLLGEVQWWQSDDFWTYAFYAFLAYVRVAAERTERSVGDVARSIAGRRGVPLDLPDT
jgi:hypothetical protein